MADVLDFQGHLIDEPACRFEHLLARGIEERVCALLGHPKRCPHGQPIPPGACCQRARGQRELRLVSPLTGLQPGQGGRVAYLHVDDPRRTQKLMSMGVLPGTQVRLLQRYPANIFQAGYSQFAVDDELAAGIYVRIEEEPRPAAEPTLDRRRRHRHGSPGRPTPSAK